MLTDAAIGIVATLGMRGLTHRAVDANAGMPPGTTSAYFRTRSALITGLTQRLADLDQAELARRQLGAGGPMMGGAGAAAPTPAAIDAVADAIAALVLHLTTQARDRTLARYACLLETTHRPELRDRLKHGEAARAQTIELLRWAGAPNPEQRAREFVAAIDGLILDRVLDPPSSASAPKEAVRRLLHAAVALR